MPLAQKLLEVPAELVETALRHELQEGTVIADDLDGRRCVFLAGLYQAEREIAAKLKSLAAGKPPWPTIDPEKAIPWVENRSKTRRQIGSPGGWRRLRLAAAVRCGPLSNVGLSPRNRLELAMRASPCALGSLRGLSRAGGTASAIATRTISGCQPIAQAGCGFLP